MILKYILMGTVCWTLNGDEKCAQAINLNVSDLNKCKHISDMSGRSFKERIAKLGGSMTFLEGHCMAIDNDGWNIDESLKISYTIL